MMSDTKKIIQQRRLEEIGQYLQQMRQESSITLEQVTQQTKIQPYQLVAIESGDLSKLPPAVYIQGLIKIYANFLGCNGQELAATFPNEEVEMSSLSTFQSQ